MSEQQATGGANSRIGHESTLVYEGTRLVAHPVIPLAAQLRVEGLEHIPASGAAILAPNHISSADIPLVAYPIKRHVHFMAKDELFHIPLLRTYIRWLGAFPVRRGESDRDALRTAERLLGEGNVVAIFPEGHRSENRALIEAHAGVAMIAMRASVPIIPVAVWGTEHILKSWNYLWRAPTVHIRYGEPFLPQAAGAKRTSADLKRNTDEIMGRIAAMLPPTYRGVYAGLVPSTTGGEVPSVTPAPAPEQIGAEGTTA